MSHSSFSSNEGYESPIEEILIKEIGNFLSHDTQILLQKELTTPNGTYRPDALLVNGSEILAIECDGKDFHTGHENELYDLWRDAFLLFHNQVDYIYRFGGREIHFFLSDIIFLLAKEKPQFFDKAKTKKLVCNFTQYFFSRSEEKYNNEVMVKFHAPEGDAALDGPGERGFYYSYRDKKEWFPNFGPEALLLGELFPGNGAKRLIEEFGKFGLLGDDLFVKIECEKPGALLKYIHFFKDWFNYFGEKGKLIKKYKELAGYPLDKTPGRLTIGKASYQEQNIALWNQLVKKIISLDHLPQSIKWTNIDAIIKAVRQMQGYENNVNVYFPKEGDSHLFDIVEGYEEGFVEIHSGSYVHIGQPESLEFISVADWTDSGYFKLSFQAIEPIKFQSEDEEYEEQSVQKNYQTLLEYRPTKYTSAESEKEKHERYVRRYTNGYLVFFRNCSADHTISKIV
jgi:hypothetical protein